MRNEHLSGPSLGGSPSLKAGLMPAPRGRPQWAAPARRPVWTLPVGLVKPAVQTYLRAPPIGTYADCSNDL
eukprot:scaffold3031_cov393-Prasinococcus_capsulatus_cf.AAC.3